MGGIGKFWFWLPVSLLQTFCKALILLRNKNLINPTSLLELFFQLLRCHDKLLRKVSRAYKNRSWFPAGFDQLARSNAALAGSCSPFLGNKIGKFKIALLFQHLTAPETRLDLFVWLVIKHAAVNIFIMLLQAAGLSCIWNWAAWMCLQKKTINTLLSKQVLLNSLWELVRKTTKTEPAAS